MMQSLLVILALVGSIRVPASEGLQLEFRTATPEEAAASSRIPCGVLTCTDVIDEGQSFVTPSTGSDDIAQLEVYKKLQTDTSGQIGVVIAKVTTGQNYVTSVANSIYYEGHATPKDASLQLEIYKEDDCWAVFTCRSKRIGGVMEEVTYNRNEAITIEKAEEDLTVNITLQLLSMLEKLSSEIQGLGLRFDGLERQMTTLRNTCNRDDLTNDVSSAKQERRDSEKRLGALISGVETSILTELDLKCSMPTTQLEQGVNTSCAQTLVKVSVTDDVTMNSAPPTTVKSATMSSTMLDLFTPEYDQPVECKKGMHSVPTSTPFPYPVIIPKTGSNLTKPYMCDTTTEQGGWIVIQRRAFGNTSFFRDWDDYKHGFGSLDGDFWFGLEDVSRLTTTDPYELRVDLEYLGQFAYAQYSSIVVEPEDSNYRLVLGTFSGDAGDSLKYHNGTEFSTKDRDNDEDVFGSCAYQYVGAWWYKDCLESNLNGEWAGDISKGLRWKTFTNYESATLTEMKIRKIG